MRNINKLMNFLGCSVISLIMVGCATSNPFEKVKNSSEKIALSGFSVLPPQGKGWYQGKKDSQRIVFARKGNKKTQSIIAMAIVHGLPAVDPDTEEEFLKIVSEIRRRSKNPRFSTILKKEVISREKSTSSIRFHTKYKDYAAKNKPKSAKYMITEDIGILWRHPENKNIGLTIGLSQRHLEGDPIPNFEEMANEFIKSANIEPL